MVNSKTGSEAKFPMKRCRTSPLNSSKLRVEMHNCHLAWMRKIDKFEWCKQYRVRIIKINESNKTSINNRVWARVREIVIANTKKLFRASSNSVYISAFTAWRIFTIHLGFSQRNYNTNYLHKTRSTKLQSSNLYTRDKDKANEEYNLVTIKITNSLFTTS